MDRETWEECHRVLGVPPGASQNELKAAYRRLVREHHPDAVDGGRSAKRRGEAAFKSVQSAYEALRDHRGPPPMASETVPQAPAEEPAGPGRRSIGLWVGVGLVVVSASLFIVRMGRRKPPEPRPAIETATREEIVGAIRRLRENAARMHGAFNFELKPGKGRVYVEDSAGAAVLLLNYDRREKLERLNARRSPPLGFPDLALDYERGVLTGLVRRRDGGEWEVLELGLALEGADIVRIAGDPDGPGILVSHSRGGTPMAVTSVTALDFGPRQ